MIKEQIYPSILITLLFTILTGVLFPVAVWIGAQVAFGQQANGSFHEWGGRIVGSELIGQTFTEPKYFHGRPSAAGSGYDSTSSSGTNLGPTSRKLFSGLPDDPATKDVDESFPGVDALAKGYRTENGLNEKVLVPVDAVTRSGSGLDPHISLLNASLQSVRIANERHLKLDIVSSLIDSLKEGRFLGIFGEPRVNVLLLNIALDDLAKQKQ